MGRIKYLALAAILPFCFGFGVFPMQMDSVATSEPSTLLFHYDAAGTSAGNVIVSQEATTVAATGTVDFTQDGCVGKGAEVQAGDTLSFNGGTNIETAGKMTLCVKTTGTVPAYATVVDGVLSDGAPFRVQKYSTFETWLRLKFFNNTNWNIDVGVNIFDGSLHTVAVSWDVATNTQKVQVDGGTIYSTTAYAMTGATVNTLYLGSEAGGGVALEGIVDEIKIYDTTL